MTLTLGTSRSGAPARLSDEERSRHVHVVGASGSGKSKLLESMLRQDITAGRGLCLIDPHGTLVDDVVQWCAATGMDRRRRIHLIEPADTDWALGFNPLRRDERTETALRVDAMVGACAQVWGGEDTNSTPLLKKCLRAVFYALIVRDLTLVEAPFLTTNSDVRLRRTLTDHLPDEVFRAVWRDFESLSPREFFEQFSSTNNRLLEFLGSPVVRRIIGQKERAVDLRQVMDGGDILLVNLNHGGRLSPDNARLLGTLLTSELFMVALTRDTAMAEKRPFSLYVDECYDFLTSDIERMLDQTRKFGLHVVLSHQRLAQLKQRSETIYNGVMAGGQTKIVFGGLADEDAEIMAREVMRTTINLQRPKHVLDKPIVVDEVPYWLEAYGTTESESTTETAGESSSWTISGGTSLGERSDSEETSTQTSSGESSGGGSAWSRSSTASRSSSQNWSQTLKPVRKVMPTAVHSLEEEMHLAIVKLRQLPNATAIVRRPGKVPVRIRTAHISPALATKTRVASFEDTVRAASDCLTASPIADAEILARQQGLAGSGNLPPDYEDFWAPET